MAAAARQDDQGNVVQVGEGEEGEEGETPGCQRTSVQAMKGDEVPPIPVNLETLLMEEHMDAIPWIPYHPDPMESSRQPYRHALRCWPASQPWTQVKVSASPT